MTESQKQLIEYLEAVTTMRAAANLGHCAQPYHCIEDFVLQRGRFFTPQQLPKGIKRGTERRCFENAGKLAARRGASLVYVEGFALGEIPIHHAWVSDSLGNVYEVTWQTKDWTEDDITETSYFGVAFNADFVLRVKTETKLWGVLDDVKRRWPVLRGIYQPGEMLEPSLMSALERNAL